MMDNGKRKALLVIDDDPEFRALVAAIADFCDVPVLQAADCCRGMEVLDQERDRIKIVLLDYLMPGMEPLECASAIVAKAGPSIQVVLVTAAADPAARAAGTS